MYSKEQLAEIFKRIGLSYDENAVKDEKFISEIHYACVTSIPYENLDIMRNIPLELSEEAYYEKIVIRGRGGYCFEVNGFLACVFRSLGLKVREYFARYLRGEKKTPMRRHRVIVVTSEDGKNLLCDIGVGEKAPRLPLEFRDGFVSEQFGEIYRLTKEPFYGWLVCDYYKGRWRPFYSFTSDQQLNLDFKAISYWCEHHPDSPVVNEDILSIKTSDGRITMNGNVFRIFSGDGVEEKTLTDEEKTQALKDYFGIAL